MRDYRNQVGSSGKMGGDSAYVSCNVPLRVLPRISEESDHPGRYSPIILSLALTVRIVLKIPRG